MDAFALSCSLTWDKFQTTKAKTVSIFEDPVYSTYVTKDIFIEMYGACLETLDGDDETAFVDFYFEPSPLNNSIYIFRNEEAKLDFRDLAIELGLIPEIREIMEGETKVAKAIRLAPKQAVKAPVSSQTKVQHRTAQAQKTLDHLMQQLKEETDPRVRENLQRKIEKTLKHLDTSI